MNKMSTDFSNSPAKPHDWESNFLQCVWKANLLVHEVMYLFLKKANQPGSKVLSVHHFAERIFLMAESMEQALDKSIADSIQCPAGSATEPSQKEQVDA